MAETVVSSVVGKVGDTVVSSVVGTVGNLLIQKIAFLKAVEGQVQKLKDELARINCFLEDADRKQDGDARIRKWVSEIRDVSYDVEDAIEVFVSKMEAIKRKPFILRCAYRIHYLDQVGKQIRSIQSRIADINASRQRYGIINLGEGTNDDAQRLQHLKRRTLEYAQDKNIVGIKVKADYLVSQLLKPDSSRCMFPITGMGGIGKTTLAREIYNHSDVQKEFPCRAWVCVSERFNFRDIMQTIINQVKSSDATYELEKMQDDDLKRLVNQCLKGKRYLIVLDDVWQEEWWDVLKDAFPDEGKGNRLLITSRKKNVVAQHADSLRNLYELETLGVDESWVLFVKTAFSDGSCPSHLEDLGRKIVQHCGGLPLAIVTIGSLLSQKTSSVSVWEGVLGDISRHLGGTGNGVSTILELSYRDLPPHLRFCFKYLGLFPEDHEIPLRKLVHMWVAEGVVVSSRGERRCMEEIAEDYLEQLISRNMVQVARDGVDYRVKSCQLHDILRDLAIKKGRDENFLEIIGSGTRGDESGASSPSPRYIAVQEEYQFLQCSPRLRTIVVSSRNIFSCKMLKLLRVLDFQDCEIIRGLPSQIGEMSLLRYLGLRGTLIDELPESLGRLSRLQTLDVRSLGQIPNVIWKLECLRHLYVSSRMSQMMPVKVEGLKYLCTLSDISYKQLMENDLTTLTSLETLKIRRMKTLDVLSLSLFEIASLRSLTLTTVERAEPLPPLDGICKMSHLSVLKLQGRLGVLPPLPPNLSRLVLKHSWLQTDPMPMLAKLERLTFLKLGVDAISGRIKIPRQGFYQLNFLEFRNLSLLREIAVEKGALPELRRFRISGSNWLQIIPEELRCKMV